MMQRGREALQAAHQCTCAEMWKCRTKMQRGREALQAAHLSKSALISTKENMATLVNNDGGARSQNWGAIAPPGKSRKSINVARSQCCKLKKTAAGLNVLPHRPQHLHAGTNPRCLLWLHREACQPLFAFFGWYSRCNWGYRRQGRCSP